MGQRLLLAAVAMAGLVPSAASARAVCGHSGAELNEEIADSSSVFLARIESPATALHPVPAGHRGSRGADVEMVVTRVLKGPLRVGDRVSVHWEGWSEPQTGAMVGGCRVPATDTTERYPIEILVVARGPVEALRVRNDSSSQRVGAANRNLVRRIARLARR